MLKKALITILTVCSVCLAFALLGYGLLKVVEWDKTRPREVAKIENRLPDHLSQVKIDALSRVITEHGLYKITIDDSTKVLLYISSDCATMIQTK